MPRQEPSTHKQCLPERYWHNERSSDLNNHSAFIATSRPLYAEAMASPQAIKWWQAVKKDYNQLVNQKGIWRSWQGTNPKKGLLQAKLYLNRNLMKTDNFKSIKCEL